MTGLPCVTVHQRLAPQNPFPAAFLDIFYGYLCLLGAPPGSPQSPMAGKSIVIAGDSSGACLALGLLQVLLNLKRNGVSTIEFHGRKVKLELPAGLTLLSAVGDLTNSLPSYKENFLTDWFPAYDPKNLPGFPTCEIWPADPPRGNIYCDVSILDHPLVSPTASRDWTGSPPLWFASGQEMIVDAPKLIAQTAFSQGTTVVFQEYESMPHIFMTQFLDSSQSRKCWSDWAGVCKSLINADAITSKAEFIKAKGLQIEQLDLTKLTVLTVEEARRRMRQAAKAMTPFTGRTEDMSKL
jgi:acetyl esterase/lipase